MRSLFDHADNNRNFSNSFIGIVLSVAISVKEENEGFLVFLDGKLFEEIARAEFTASPPLVNDFHGIFLGANNKPFTT